MHTTQQTRVTLPVFALVMVAATVAILATPYYLMAPLPALGMLFLILLSRNPVLAYYILVFLIPYGNYRKIGGVNLPWVIAGFLIVILLVHMAVNKRVLENFRANIILPLLLVVVIGVLSTMMSEFHGVAMQTVLLHVAALIFVLLGLAFINEHAYRSGIPAIVLVSVTLGSFMALLGTWLGVEWFWKATSGRAIGGAIDANNLSVMTLFILPLVIQRMVHARHRWERVIMVLILPVNLLTIVATYSRSGFLVMILCFLMLLHHYGKRYMKPRNLGLLLGAGAIALLTMLPMIPQSFWERQASLAKWGDTALGRRTSYLYVAKRAFLEKPFLGHGPGAFYYLYEGSPEAQQWSRKNAALGRRAHNTYLEILVGMGIAGLIAFLTAIFLSLRNFIRAEHRFKRDDDLEMMDLTAAYRISMTSLLIFLLFFSEEHHKFLLLSMALSYVGWHMAKTGRSGAVNGSQQAKG